eukprot:m.298606 g.298606  ORF g.298606 m.298606 type:complete len:80 (+) comp95028_c0_seq1:40-279(+)
MMPLRSTLVLLTTVAVALAAEWVRDTSTGNLSCDAVCAAVTKACNVSELLAVTGQPSTRSLFASYNNNQSTYRSCGSLS